MDGEHASPDPSQAVQPEQTSAENVPVSANTGQHIDVTYHGGSDKVKTTPPLTEGLAPIEDGNASNVGLVEDVSKAWDMAHAGKESRDEAALYRSSAKDTQRNIDEIDTSGISKKAIPNRKSTMEASAQDDRLNAEVADRKADNLENWAAILHDHPVSEAYQQAHQTISFNPQSLSKLEGRAEVSREEAEALDKELTEAPLTVGTEGMSIWVGGKRGFIKLTPSEAIYGAYGITPEEYEQAQADGEELPEHITDAAREKIEQYLSLIKNEDTTLGQLKDFYVEAVRKTDVEPELDYAKRIATVLEDIKGGQASV
jgi:hypothetical protein